MKIILLSGGSGKRLWPLSNNIRSKQFLKLLKKDDGSLESMVQRVCRQISEAGLDADLLVATGKSQVDSLKRQLEGKCDIVIEPCRRDTFPAIMLSCAYLKYVKEVDDNEVVVVMPVDPFADINYFEVFKDMAAAVKNGAGDMALMGIKPTYPSAKYGYIMPEKSADGITRVSSFVEKPSEDVAEDLIKQGALWNGGVFAFKLGYVISTLNKYTDKTTFEDLCEDYSDFKKISFDYEVVEKASNIVMVPYNGIWKDLGTWNTVTEQMGCDILGEGMVDETCKNTHIINELAVPVVAMGCKDMVIAASADGVLVADKHQSSYLKPLVENINSYPMFVEKAWGECRVLDYSSYNEKSTATQHLVVLMNKSTEYTCDKEYKHIITVVNGSGEIKIGTTRIYSSQGTCVSVDPGMFYSIKAFTDMNIIDIKIEKN